MYIYICIGVYVKALKVTLFLHFVSLRSSSAACISTTLEVWVVPASLCSGSGPKGLMVGHRISWGILSQTPVFSLRSVRCRGRASSLLCS
jgi:hypothetical protein